MKIERFEPDADGHMDPWEHGDWVRFEDAEQAVAADRAACAELVREAGCSCRDLHAVARLWDEDDGITLAGEGGDRRVVQHGPLCPQALAAAILARGESQ